jgi:DNA-binding transcriptional MerR regulator
MSRAREIAALRALGFSLAQVARVLKGDSSGLEPALAAHQAVLEDRLRQLVGTVDAHAGRGLDARVAGDVAVVVELHGTTPLTPMSRLTDRILSP